MTRPLPQRDVEARATRGGRPRLSNAERRALSSIKDESLRRVIAELLISTRSTQENFQEIEQWFPVTAGGLSGGENSAETKTGGFWLRWRRLIAHASKVLPTTFSETIRGWASSVGATTFHTLRMETQAEPNDAEHDAHIDVYAFDEDKRCGVLAVAAGFTAYIIKRESDGSLASDFLKRVEFLAKGDLLTATAASTPKRLKKGEDGQVLSADSSTETGLKWIEAPTKEGPEGRQPGLHYTWLTNTEASDPGAGKVKRSATNLNLRISETDRDGNNVAAFLAAWDDSTTTGNRGTILIRQVGAPKKFRILKITGAITDEGAWDSIPTELIAEGEALENEKEVVIEWFRTGDKGDTGEKGATGEKGEKGEKGATGPEGKSPAAVKIRATAQSAAGTGNLEMLYSDISANGLLVLIVANQSTPADEVSEVTVAGVPMVELPGSPFLHTAGSEDGVIYAYFLSKPSVGGSVQVKVTGAATKRALAIGLSTGDDSLLTVCDTETKDVAAGKVFETNELGAPARHCLVIGALHSGADAVGTITVPEGEELLFQHDFGTTTAHWIARTEAALGGGKFIANSSVEEEGGILAVAVAPVNDWGIVTAFPTEGVGRGDVCRIVADATKGVIWEFVYDGVGELPWKFQGGPPLFDEVLTDQATSSAAYTALTTAGPSVTIPVKGDYDVEVGCRSWSGGTAYGFMSYKVGGTAASDEDARRDIGGVSGMGGGGTRPRRKTGLAATISLVAQYRSGTGGTSVNFEDRWMRVCPVRAG